MAWCTRHSTVCLLLVCGALAVAEASKLNVLFLVVDDLRPQLGCYGQTFMSTPNVDQLASRSVRFNRAYIQQAVCSPSRTSFLTGRRPDTTRIFDLSTYFRNISGNFTTLPQHFKSNGYVTQSVGKIFHPGVASGGKDDYPYSWSYPAYHAPAESQRGAKVCPGPGGNKYFSARCPVNVQEQPDKTLPDIQNTDFAIQFLQNRSSDQKPFFLALGFHKPHLPFKFPEEYLSVYPLSTIQPAPNPRYPSDLPEVAYAPWDEIRIYDDVAALNLTYPFQLMPEQYQLLLRQAYYAATTYVDAQVGRVLAALEQNGFANNTIVTFHGDHGWQLGEHDEWCKHTNFELATRVPMLVYIPGVTSHAPPGGRVFPFRDVLPSASLAVVGRTNRDTVMRMSIEDDALHAGSLVTDLMVEAVDLFPTLSELAGLEVPPTCPPAPFNVSLCTEGSSLVPVIRNVTGTGVPTPLRWKTAVFSQYPRPSLVPQNDSDNALLSDIRFMGYTMRTDGYRYTEWVAYDPATFTADWTNVYARELYLHSSDPEENSNVADDPEYADLVASLSKQLRAGWRKALPGNPKTSAN